MADQLKPGDVVQLKSGGPKMTIESMYDPTKGRGAVPSLVARCFWFTGHGISHEGGNAIHAIYPLVALKLADD